MATDRPAAGHRDTPAEAAPVVAGVDHSEPSFVATRLAAREAATQHRPLLVVHAFNWDARSGDQPDGELRAPAEELVARAAATARAAEPGLEVAEILVEGPAVAALLRQSSPAALLAIGDGELNRCTSILADATAVQLAARAGCSVLVARATPAPPGVVLAAVDGSASSAGVLDLAFDTAERHHDSVAVLQARETISAHSSGQPAPGEPDEEATEALTDLVAEWRRRYPSVPATAEARTGDPAAMLIARSRTAELVVVGARGAEAWRSGLGEIAQGLLHHAPVPVLIAHTNHQLYVQH